MRLVFKWTAIAVVVVVLIGSFIAVSRKQPHTVGSAPYAGYQLSAFTLPRLANGHAGPGLSTSAYAGKPMFINFWASWCPPCQAETPDLVKAYKQFGNKVQFIGVNVTAQDSLANASAFVKHYGIDYPVLLDQSNAIANQFQVSAFPTSFFVNASGTIVLRVEGAVTPQQLTSTLQKIAGGP
ncbi:TlpA family protein disulfide reductase [Alicyclobacillus tolerans]|uniref:TlpA family protein disulfide reductase n=1 Tax=Alicyclobacillus tolerans TaxID=90970 RepID=UPI001F343C88|nr:TlpA disulfide reductase family protein [Alicyclobacillus tolerans]MCF8566438.1 TlpA family protein disulfide reductase [Alicyclobacillus tolerans]